MDKYEKEYEETQGRSKFSPRYLSAKKWYRRKQMFLALVVLLLISIAAYSFSNSMLKYKSVLGWLTFPSTGQVLKAGEYSLQLVDCSSRTDWMSKDSCFRHLAKEVARKDKAGCNIFEEPYKNYCRRL